MPFAALAPAAAGPADLLDRFDTFSARTTDAAFSSVCSAWLDPAAGTLRYACAGHPPPLVLHPDGTVLLLDQGRSSLVSVSDAPRAEATTTLPAGARLLLYTDGLIERRTTSIDAGLRRLAEAAARHRGSHLEDFCDAVLAEMLADEGTIDDVALLCVELLLDGTAPGHTLFTGGSRAGGDLAGGAAAPDPLRRRGGAPRRT